MNIHSIPDDWALYLIKILALEEKSYKNIDKVFEKYQLELFQLVKGNNSIKKVAYSKFFTELRFLWETYSRKLYLLYIYDKENKIDDISKLFDNLIMSKYRYLIDFLMAKKIVKCQEVREKVLRKYGYNLNTLELSSVINMGIILSYILDKEIDFEDLLYKQQCGILKESIGYKLGTTKKYGDKDFMSETLQDPAIKKLVYPIYKEVEKRLGEIKSIDDLYKLDGGSREYNEFLKLSAVFNFESMVIALLDNIDLYPDDIRELIVSYCIKTEKVGTEYHAGLSEDNFKNIDNDELIMYLVKTIVLKAMIKEYASVKEYFIENSNEVLFTKLETQEQELKNLRNELQILKEEKQRMKTAISTYESKLNASKSELERSNYNKNELEALRNYMFNNDNKVETDNVRGYDLEYLSSVKGLIVGGTPKWQTKLKEILPKWKYLSSETLNFDEGIVKNAEVVVFYINYLSHPLYYKVVNSIGNSDIKIVYIDNTTNVEQVLGTIYSSMKN
jgi:hypothetical protein